MASILSTYSPQQGELIINTVQEIIERLPGKALEQLLNGFSGDVDKMVREITLQTANVYSLNSTLDSRDLDYLEDVKTSMDISLKKFSYNYFKTTVLPNFHQGWRNLEWGNLVQLYPKSAYLASRSHGKCFSPETEVVMYSGEIKKVKELKVGDLLMGVDSSPRKVLEIHSGNDEMFLVEQNRTENFICNSEHILHYKIKRGEWNNKKRKVENLKDIIEEVPVKDFLNFSKTKQSNCRSYRVKGWELPKKELPLEPYFVGLWLGDGGSGTSYITNEDQEVVDYLKEYADRLGLKISNNKNQYKITTGIPGRRNIVLNSLKSLNMLNNKHIPDIYLYGDKEQRLQLLAGLLDSDGHFYKNENTFDIGMVNERLMKQIQLLCWSLGFRASFRKQVRMLNLKRGLTEYVTYGVKLSGDTWEIPTKIKRKKAKRRENHWIDLQKSSFKVSSVGRGEYIGFSVDKDHLFLLKDGTVLHNSYEFSFAFPLWRVYSYDRPDFFVQEDIDNKNRKETALISNTATLGRLNIGKIVEEISCNEILSQKINPNGKATLNAESVVSETGSKIHMRGKEGFIRGLHVGAVVNDDLPDDSSIYSAEQREKLLNIFKGAINPIVEPYGFNLVSGTPYQERDLYYELKKPESGFAVFEYPAIFPDGRLLSPDRFTFEKLMAERESLGTLVFAREYLVVPISDDSTIFPYEILMRSTAGMENINFVENVDSFPIKMQRIVIGCDFARSGNVGADYTVFSVWGIDAMHSYYLLHIFRAKGLSHNEQLSRIMTLDRMFKPSVIVFENNGFQSILADLARENGMKNIKEFTTTSSNKKNLRDGLPSLAALFERGVIRIPYSKVFDTKDKVDALFGEFNSIAFRSDKDSLESVSGHDDMVMSSFFAITELRNNMVEFRVDWV